MTEYVLAVVLGLLVALGTFLVLRRDVVRVVWGVTIISQSANVYLITMGGVGVGGSIPIVGAGADPATVTDPLVQALVLTAIVIGFGTTAFALVLTYRVYEEHGTVDLAELGRGASGPDPTGEAPRGMLEETAPEEPDPGESTDDGGAGSGVGTDD
jgi:multicomponent Na+:H+ antiporter subunit C